MKLDLGNPEWRTTLPPSRSVASDAPVAACAFSRDGKIAAFALGDGRVRLLPADVKDAAAPKPGADPQGRGAVADRRSARATASSAAATTAACCASRLDGSATEIANQKGKWIDKLAAHRSNGTIAASVGKMALVVDKSGEVREFGPHQSTVTGDRLQQGRQPHRLRALRRHHGVEHRPGDPAAAPLRLARQPCRAEVEHRRQVHRHRHAGERHPCLAHRPGERHAHGRAIPPR